MRPKNNSQHAIFPIKLAHVIPFLITQNKKFLKLDFAKELECQNIHNTK